MARKSLRAQLNQIRAWVRQGRTDAWIAHQLEVSAAELREFRRRHGLTPDGEDSGGEIDLRDEIEAEIEAATLAAEEEEADLDDEDEDEDEDEEKEAGEQEPEEEAPKPEAAADDKEDEPGEDGGDEGGARRRRRRRGGRGRRGRGRAAKPLEATFDHGAKDGYGLWLDPAVADNPTYAEHWQGHRAVEVEITPEQIVIRRSGEK